jgi:hypothetical protein
MALAVFCIALSVPFPHIAVPILLSFLHLSGLAVPTIKTYFSSIKARFRLASLSVHPFNSSTLSLAFISLEKFSSFYLSQAYFFSCSAS